MLKRHTGIEYSDEEFPSSPLAAAVYKKHKKIVELLISHDVLISELGFMIALDHQDIEMVELLLKGNLAKVDWSAFYFKVHLDFKANMNDEVMIDILRIIRKYVSSYLEFSYKFLKEVK